MSYWHISSHVPFNKLFAGTGRGIQALSHVECAWKTFRRQLTVSFQRYSRFQILIRFNPMILLDFRSSLHGYVCVKQIKLRYYHGCCCCVSLLTMPDLSEPVDVYSEWIDACEAANTWPSLLLSCSRASCVKQPASYILQVGKTVIKSLHIRTTRHVPLMLACARLDICVDEAQDVRFSMYTISKCLYVHVRLRFWRR